ncbi:hypothetical protein CDL15_Pgr025912 [Punica granatum]|uniref:Transketolase N-terminal domain-containing protein n=1 Tax=Punica granatum TaxID=22663 RepID=A0A218WBZ5_PUNGR|nr:hypothetical protein CDL15_Pgr025912 [Punica granatum]PKI72387.1 hypothetical protein CRG98_007257 [Punica granatum]
MPPQRMVNQHHVAEKDELDRRIERIIDTRLVRRMDVVLDRITERMGALMETQQEVPNSTANLEEIEQSNKSPADDRGVQSKIDTTPQQGELIRNFLKNDDSQLTTSPSIAFYYDNHISIDGDTEIAFIESVDTRFGGLGWHVIWVKNDNTGYDEIRAAINEAKAVKDKPTLIKIMITIGSG